MRDTKGLHNWAATEEITEFTGITAPYEAPNKPDLVIDTAACARAGSTLST